MGDAAPSAPRAFTAAPAAAHAAGPVGRLPAEPVLVHDLAPADTVTSSMIRTGDTSFRAIIVIATSA